MLLEWFISNIESLSINLILVTLSIIFSFCHRIIIYWCAFISAIPFSNIQLCILLKQQKQALPFGSLHLCILIVSFLRIWNQGSRGQWAVYYTSPQSFILTFSYRLAQQIWGLLMNFDWLVHKAECPNVSTTNCNMLKK